MKTIYTLSLLPEFHIKLFPYYPEIETLYQLSFQGFDLGV